MSDPDLDRLELEHLALRRGLPREIASAIGGMVSRAGLMPARRDEVLEELIAHFEDGLASGRPPAELLAAFGDASLAPPPPALPFPVPRRGDRIVPRLIQDLRYAARRLRASPGFTLVAVLSLALGLGATTAVFSLINAVILRPTSVAAPERVVDIYETSKAYPYNATTNPDLADLRRGTTRVFSEVAGTRFTMAQVTRDGGVSRVMGEVVTGSYFPLLQIAPALGRLLGPEDDVAPGAHAVVVLGNGYWHRAFAADPAVVGKTIQLNGRAYSIVGVVREDYQGNTRGVVPDFYAPMMMVNQLSPGNTDVLQARGEHGLFAKARLRPGATLAGARAAATGVAAELKRQGIDDWVNGTSFTILPTADVIIFPGVDRMLYPVAGFLLTIVGLVLLVVCANLASFLLARGLDRRKEIAVRLALGATRQRLLSQLLTETVLLGLLGGAGGLLFATLIARVLTTTNLPLPVPLTLDLTLDGRVLLFATAVSLAAGALFGLVPALRTSNPRIASTLRDESAGGGQRGRLAMRHGLVVAQIAASLVLLIAAGLFVRSMRAVEAVDPGFGREPSGILEVVFPPSRYADASALLAERELAGRIRRLPGVTAVGMIDNLPLNLLNQQDTELGLPGVVAPEGQGGVTADYAVVDTGYFAAAGVRLLEGRDFGPGDGADAPGVAIVNQQLARRLWLGKRAVGQRVTRGKRILEVVGVVATTKIRSLGEDPRTGVYVALAQAGASGLWYVARTTGDAEQTASAMLRAAQDLDPELIPIAVRSMDRHLGVVRLPMRMAALVVTALAMLAVVLAAIGLYGTVSYAVAQRTREVGIRLALGADSPAMVRMLMGGGVRLVAWGSLTGLALSLLLARLISRLLFGVGAFDPATFVAVPVLLLVVASVAAWLPARRASRVAPTEALRAEG